MALTAPARAPEAAVQEEEGKVQVRRQEACRFSGMGGVASGISTLAGAWGNGVCACV